MKNFGKKAKDLVTGFSGIITAKCDYMYGCSQYLITPRVDKDNKTMDGKWFDKGRINISEQVINPVDVQATEPGCDFREHPTC